MRVIYDFLRPSHAAPSLLVLLPGAYDTPEDFVREGFVDAVRKRALPLDIALVDANVAFISSGTLLPELHTLISSRQQYGTMNIWLAGISIGGMISMMYADTYQNDVNGVCLLAPYPGNRAITGEISAAGGILSWEPPLLEADDERRAWRWLRQRNTNCAVWLGYGRQDRFAPGHELMAPAISADYVKSIDGDHDWPTWYRLWQIFLDMRLIS